MMSDEHIKWIWVKQAVSDRSKKSYRLFETFKTVDKIYEASEKDYESLDFLDSNDRDQLCRKKLTHAVEESRICEQLDIKLTSIEDDDYPALLREIDNPPVMLYHYGNYQKAFAKPVITIVGTRNCTTYGESVATFLGSTLTSCGFSIGCGVARGVDFAAMNGAIKADGSAILVLPDGLAVTNYSNKYKIKDLRYNGVVISEHLLSEPTTRYAYHERNRILSGIALGTIVAQAPRSSGALITANYALEQGRDVFAVPANIDMDQSAGSNKLIKDGAIPIFGFEDVLETYLPKYPDLLTRNVSTDGVKLAKHDSDDDFVKAEDFRRVVLNDLEFNEKPIFELISYKEVTIDYIIDRSQMKPADVLSILTSLEAKGAIRKLPGNKYIISVK